MDIGHNIHSIYHHLGIRLLKQKNLETLSQDSRRERDPNPRYCLTEVSDRRYWTMGLALHLSNWYLETFSFTRALRIYKSDLPLLWIKTQ